MRSQEEDPSLESPAFAVVEDWQQCAEARRYVNLLLKRNKRRTFGLLERPVLDQYRSTPLLHRRLFLVGKAGVGKTSTVDRLLGRDISPSHVETLGIQTSTVFWPTKLVSPHAVLLVELELWDVGERTRNKFDHILPTCKQATDGVAFFFSYTDRHSWEDLPHLISSTVGDGRGSFVLVVGTHADSPQREVTEDEVEHFQSSSKLAVLPIANTNCPRLRDDSSTPDGRAGINEITPFLNALTQILLVHQQRRHSGATLEDVLASLSQETESPSSQ